MNKKENFALRALKGIGFFIVGDILNIFLVMSMILLDFMLFKVIISVCALAIQLGLMFNWAYNAANKDKNLEKYHGAAYDRLMPMKMGLTAPIISYVGFIAAVLSKLKLIPDIFSIFLLSSLYILPSVDLFTSERTIDFISWAGMFGILLLVLLQPAIIAVSYILTYKEVNIAQLIMYKKK